MGNSSDRRNRAKTDHKEIGMDAATRTDRSTGQGIDASVFPLEKGGRPLFTARKLLESIDRQGRLGLQWRAASRAECRCWAAGLRVLSELVSRRSVDGSSLSDSDLVRVLLGLPVFFSAEMAHRWETERPWMADSFELSESAAAVYGALLDSARPSDAYQSKSGEWGWVWRMWMAAVPIADVRAVLEYSASVIEAWDALRPGPAMPLTQNIKAISDRLGLSGDDAAAWEVAEVYGGLCPIEVENVWDLAREDSRHAEDFLGMWESAAGLVPGSLGSLLAIDGPLARLRFCWGLDLAESMLENSIGSTWSRRWSNWTRGQSGRHELRSMHAGPYGALQAFLRPARPASLALSSWSHTDPSPEKMSVALCGPRVTKILIWGPPGTGKTQLALSLARSAGLGAWEPKWPAPDAERASEMNLTAVAQAREFASAIKSTLLIVDECERVWGAQGGKASVIEILDNPGTPQIWIANSLSGCDPALLRRFDMVVEAREMPRAARQVLAAAHFGDEDLAFRVAQALKTPAAIAGAARWCEASGDTSWTGVCSYMAGQTKAVQAAGSDAQSMSFPVAEDDGLPMAPLAGNEALEEMITRLVDAMSHPQRYKKMGAALPKGVLLIGPPGTGKTLFAKHLAKRIGAPMIVPDTAALAADPSQIRVLFHEARRMAPCLVFLDEIDALLSSPLSMGGLDSKKQQVVNSFLAELDGMSPMEGVLVVGATHRGEKMLEPAALRAGRMSEVLTLEHPSERERESIWRAHLGMKATDADVDCAVLAGMSSSFSGAEIAESVNRAALSAARTRKESLGQSELESSCDDVFWGAASSSRVVSESERWSTAVHEAGHAMLAWKNGMRVPRVTARPRSGFMGATQTSREEGEHSMTRSSLLGRVEMMLGGLAAEETVFGEFANGGTSDLEGSRKLLMHGFAQAGLGKSLPWMSGGDQELWSESRKMAIEAEEAEAMAALFASAKSWLTERRQLLEDFAGDLLAARELSGTRLASWAAKTKATIASGSEVSAARAELAPAPGKAGPSSHVLHEEERGS